MLPRLYPIDNGRVLIDGIDILELPVAQLRREVRLLAQDALLLRGSLLDNLTAFAYSATPSTAAATSTTTETTPEAMLQVDAMAGVGAAAEAEVEAEAEAWRVFEQLGLHTRLQSLPLGLRTSIEDANLSEGELQLVSLCRAVVAYGGRQAVRVLLCDEPTSNVDYGSDGRVMDLLLGLECTLLINAHRLQHIHRLDLVCVLHDGRLVEQGPPADLLASADSRFSAMWRASTVHQDVQGVRPSHSPSDVP